MVREMAGGASDIENRLARLRLTGEADRFGGRARKHVERFRVLANKDSLLADTYLKAAHEYCLATEALHEVGFLRAAA